MNIRRISSVLQRAVCIPMLFLALSMPALAALTITPITWNVVGLDSNSPTTGPFQFPVAARVCAVGVAHANVSATFAFQTYAPPASPTNGDAACASSTPCITLRLDTLSTLSLGTLDPSVANIDTLVPNGCADAYFEVEVKKEAAAYAKARRYTISATDTITTISTPQPRELYVERLISQNRNSVQNVSYSGPLTLASAFPTLPASLTSTSAGGSFGLAVGSIYDIRLDASTATQGYEQLETFANFSNAVFRILRVRSTYTANTSPFYPQPPNTITSFLYANGCDWQLSPVLPNYLGCQGVGKTGGTISATYRIQVLAVPSGGNSALNTLIYDYSGSSFHYNADTSVGGRSIFVESPTDATITKAFGPASIVAGGTSTLTFTITNNNIATAITNPTFTDDFSGNLIGLTTDPTGIAPIAGSDGCVGGVITVSNGGTLLTYAGAGIMPPQTSCVISVPVRATTLGSYLNNTNPLSINGTPTARIGSATLTVGGASAPAVCAPGAPRVEIARWDFQNGTLTPNGSPPTPNPIAGATASAQFFARTATPNVSSVGSIGIGIPTRGWQGQGWQGVADPGTTYSTLDDGITRSVSFFQFAINAPNYRDLALSVQIRPDGGGQAWAGDNSVGRVFGSDNNLAFNSINIIGLPNPGTFPRDTWNAAREWRSSMPASGTGDVRFRLTVGGVSNGGGGAAAVLAVDNAVITGCNQFVTQPTLAKAFVTKPIYVGETSRLNFTVTNTSAVALTGVTFTDALPAGLEVAPNPNVNATFSAGCVGAAFTGIAGGATTLTFNGGVVAGAAGPPFVPSICTAGVDIRGTTAGVKSNFTSAIFTTETQTNSTPAGSGDDTLIVLKDVLTKKFSPNPIPRNGISKLTFIVTNPSLTDSMTSVAFSDTFPAGVVRAAVPNLTSSSPDCGVVNTNWTSPAVNQVTLTGGTVPAVIPSGGTCIYTVDVTSASVGTYNNLSFPLTYQVNGMAPTITGDTALDTLVVSAPTPRIGLQKRIGISASGPWGEFVGVAPSTAIFYQFTIENTGDVALNMPAGGWITDPTLGGGTFCSGPPTSLTVPVPLFETHIYECVVAATASASVGTFLNTATATGVPTSGPPNVTATNGASYTTKLPDLLVSKSRILPVGLLSTESASSVTYRINVSNKTPDATVSSTLAPIIVEDTLRSGITYTSFTSTDPFWSCTLVQTALDKVSCSYSGVIISGGSTSFDITVQVAAGTPDINNVAVALNGGDPECKDTLQSPITECKGPLTERSLKDYGDLPDAAIGVSPSVGALPPNYRTTVADGGPVARIVAGLRLGAIVDADLDGVNSLGNADDGADPSPSIATDDEEGLESFSRGLPGNSIQIVTANVRVTNTTGSAATICLFVDRNADGTFDDPGEIGTAAVPNNTNDALLTVTIPAPAVSPTTPAGNLGIGIRLRLALETDIGATCEFGEADGFITGSYANPAAGEVEDYYTGDSNTVPVTLSNVDVKEIGSELVVHFSTASEAGTIGFRVLADIGKGVQARVEIGSVASKAIDSLKEQSYTVRARNPGADQVWIEESSVDGKAALYGPYKVGGAVGEVGLAQPLNWAAVNAEQLSFRAELGLALRGLSAKSAEVRVSSDGWVRVTQEQLVAAGVDLSGQSANNIAVRLGSETVPARVNLGAKAFGAGSTIEFFAKAVKNSLYTKTAVYRIEIGRNLGLAEIDARTSGLNVGPEVQTVVDTMLLNSNTSYSFSSPIEDPWFSFRALRSGGAAVGVGSINFTLLDRVAPPVSDGSSKPGVSAVADETLEVSFWGGLDYAGVAPDHLAVFKLNGTVLGQVQFDGFTALTKRFTLPLGSLLSGTNTFTVELPNSTGYAADIVNVESVAVGYTRKLIPKNDRLSVVLPATPLANAPKAADANEADKGGGEQINASTFVISGLSGTQVVAVLERGGVQSVLKTDAVTSGNMRIKLATQAGDRLSIMPIDNGVLPMAAIALEDPIAGGNASYLVISHPSFIPNLGPFVLAKQQQGFTVKVVDVEAIYRYYSAGVVDPAAIQLAIRRARTGLGTTHVLLVGGDTYDYQNVLGVNSVSFIPTNYRRSGPIIAFMPSDAVYADTDSDGKPNVAIGRWPVRTTAELNAIIAKTLNYQSTKKALFISDRSLNGVNFASEVAPLVTLLSKDWTVNQLSLDSYATGQAATARADIVNALSQGVSLFSYYGHSAPASWSREGLITASQVNGGLLSPVNQAFATLQLGCWGTYFVEPTSTTVAHSMLLKPKGAVLVLGATGLTEASSDIALANGVLPRIATESFGQALMHTQQSMADENADAVDVILGGTLLGDPALK